jgi:fibronectin type 3 domain-containing protein
VTLTALEDNVKDGNQTTLLTLTSTSADAASNGLSTSTEILTVDSATEPGLTIANTPPSLTEGGASESLSFVLDTPPAAGTTVTITLSDNDSSEISYSPSTLTFTSSNWNTPQTVEVNAVEDGIKDGNQQVSLNISVSSTPAGSYGSTMDTSLTITTQDSGNTPPDSPAGFVATPTLPSGSVDLSWTEPTNPAADNYTIYWTVDPSTPIDPSKPSTYSGSITITAPATTETITGLDPANNYDFTIIATNSLGDSTPATEVDATPVPEAPTGLTASAGAASGQVDLQWNPSPGADSYTIYYSNDGGSTFTAISPNVTGTSYPHTGLNDGTEYTYYVVANNAGGTSESSDTISATPGVEPPSAPTDLTATAGSGEVSLTWTVVDGAEDYTIYVSTSGSGYTAISPDVTGTSFTHTGLTNGTNYSYYVVANNAGGAGASSNVVSARPEEPTIAPISAVTGFNVIRGVQVGKPSYYMMWDSHPDLDAVRPSPFEKNPYFNDTYYIYVSDDMGTPIDRTDSSTWDFEIDLQEWGSEHFYTNTDSDFPWVEGTQYHFAIYFYDNSKGTYSPKAVTTDPVVVPSSWANQTIDDVTVVEGCITNDNLSIYDCLNVVGSEHTIRYNEPIQSGERVIFDGQVLYDEIVTVYETRRWDFGTDGVSFRLNNADNVTDRGKPVGISKWECSQCDSSNLSINYSKFFLSHGSPSYGSEDTSHNQRFKPNTAAQPYNFAFEISSSNSAGRILHNGTLNGATDYSVESGGNGYTHSYVDTNLSGYIYVHNNSNWDNSTNDEAYVELFLDHYNNLFAPEIFNIKNISTGFSKVAIPISPPTNLAGTTPANTQQVNLTWTVSPESALSFNHVIYWKKASGSPIVIDPDDNSTYDGRIVTGENANSYTHSGLDGATQYNYVIRAETSVGGVSTSEPSVNSYARTTNSFDGGGPINPDPDEDLLVYYQFNGDLTDTAQYHGDNRYDLTAVSGANIVFADSQFSNNTAAYFDASNGYAYNNSLNDTNEDDLFSRGGFTISLWFYADEDMKQFSSLMSSRYVPETGNDGGIQSWQLDSNKNQGLRWRSQAGEDKDTRVHTSTGNTYPTNQWSHATFVKQADGTSLIYMNGVLEVTSSESQPTPMYALKIGTNRREEHPWKGYIDEFKIYKRALTAQEVNNLYINDTPSTDGTSWNQGVDFNGSSGYARNSNNWNGQNPLHRLTTITPSNSVSSVQTAASGQPWAVAAVFKPTDLSTSRTLWSQSKVESDSRHNDSVKIEINTNGRIFFNYGDDYNALQWRSANSLITAGNWYGLYVDFNGGSTGVSSSDINRYYSRFQFKLVDLSNGSVTDITSGGSWSHVNSSYGTTQDVGGYFYVGSYVTNTANRFRGQIASTVVTTLRTGQSLPDDTEVAMIVRDPIKWMTTYKIGNPWRKPNENADYSSNFATGSATGEQGTKIWLMGDGTNDSSSNIASQVNSSSSDQYLQLNSASTTSVSIPGL